MSIDSEHVNILVYRYLQESGFQHSSFTFAQESGITKCSVASTKIPPGSLIAHLQRALNYVQAEVNLTEEGLPADVEDLETIEALTLIESVQPEVCEQRRQQLRARLRENQRNDRATSENWDNENEAGSAMDVDLEIPAERVHILKGHTNEVFACAWNPKFNLLASASGDATGRIWSLDNDVEPIVLRHLAPEGEECKDVTAIDWNSSGTLLASGSTDGAARIWTRTGDLQNRLVGHSGPIFSLKWNRAGDLLVTSSVDGSAVVWEPLNGVRRQTFSFHSAPCLDVHWQNDTTFASCSTDPTIYVCQLAEHLPLKTFRGHTDEVNCIRWDPAGRYLASCSDDCSLKIWTMQQDDALHTLRHTDKVYSLNWGCGAGKPLMVASASFDATTKVWDAVSGTCMFTLNGHAHPVYSVDFHPSGNFLATGSFDFNLLIWSMQTGELTQTYRGGGGIFEVCWNETGDKIAACYADCTLAVIDFKP